MYINKTIYTLNHVPYCRPRGQVMLECIALFNCCLWMSECACVKVKVRERARMDVWVSSQQRSPAVLCHAGPKREGLWWMAVVFISFLHPFPPPCPSPWSLSGGAYDHNAFDFLPIEDKSMSEWVTPGKHFLAFLHLLPLLLSECESPLCLPPHSLFLCSWGIFKQTAFTPSLQLLSRPALISNLLTC